MDILEIYKELEEFKKKKEKEEKEDRNNEEFITIINKLNYAIIKNFELLKNDKITFNDNKNFISNIKKYIITDQKIIDIYILYKKYIINNYLKKIDEKIDFNEKINKIKVNSIITELINEVPTIIEDINQIKLKLNSYSKKNIKLTNFDKYNYTKEDFLTFLSKIHNDINDKFLEFINKLKNELIKIHKDILTDPEIQKKFNININKIIKYLNLKQLLSVDYDNLDNLITEYLSNTDERLKPKILAFLNKYNSYFNPNNGNWKNDLNLIDDDKKKELIKQVQKNFQKLLNTKFGEKGEISKEFEKLYDFYEELKKIKVKLSSGAILTKDEYEKINNFKLYIKEFQTDNKFKYDDNYKNSINNIEDLYNSIQNDKKSKNYIEKLEAVKEVKTEKFYNNGDNILKDVFKDVFKEKIDPEIEKKSSPLYNFYNKLKLIKEKLDEDKKLTDDEYEKISNLNKYIDKFKKDKLYISDDKYKVIFDDLDNFKLELNKNEELKDFLNKIKINKDKENLFRDPNKIYFTDYIAIFKLSLKLLVYISILMLLIILFISIVSFITFIYELIKNIIYLFINNTTSIRSTTIDYLSMKIIKCTKDDYTDDIFYILTEGKQSITLFNIGVYMIYLLLIYIFLYFILLLYSKIIDRDFIADPMELDKNSLFLTILLVIIIYSFIHLMMFKYIYKAFAYNPYIRIQLESNKIDETIANYILIYSTDNNNEILVDNLFFDLLYDPSRIDEINEIFKQGVLNENNDKCLEQKIIIYNLYNYLREYIVFDDDMQEKFKEYCTTKAGEKPLNKNGMHMTFVSMLNSNQIKIIRKYNEDLSYYNNIPEEKLEYLNELNKSIGNKIKDINANILINTNTSIPFFSIIIYIILIILLNFIVIYIIIIIVLSNSDGANEFNEYLYKGFYYIAKYFYEPILKFLIGK